MIKLHISQSPVTGRCAAIAVMLVTGLASAQSYLDNQTQYSNQDPNNETRRSDHFRLNFGHYNRDTGTPLTEELAQGNLQMYEQMWNRWVNEMGLHDINESSNPTYVDGNKYRTNFNFLMTWDDGGGGGAYSSADNKGFFYSMANTSSCRFDPPSGATPHEMGHVWEGTCAGFNGSNSSGAWWECTANWMQLQFLNSYPQAGGYLYNSVFYPAHGRDYYDSWMIWEAAKEDPKYGVTWVNSIWTDATAAQKVNEYIIDRMIRLDTSGSADKAGAVKDLWGDMAKKMVTWDYARQRWLAQANTPWHGDTWEWYTRCRAPLVKLPGTPGWFRPAREHIPQQFGFHFVPLTATAGTTASCNFQPLSDFVRQSDWRACLVAVNTAGQASYSALWNIGTNSITLSADQNQLYLMVIATPKPMKIVEPAWPEYTRDSGLQFPYTVSFTNTSPTHVIYPVQSHSGMVQHANGGGWKSTGATVDATAYVGPNAQVLDTAQVRGNARIEEHAVVRNSAQVRDNAVLSGHAMVQDNAQVYGNAKVRDWAMIFGYAELYENAKAIEHAGCGGGSAAIHNKVSGNVVMKGVTSVYSPSTFSGSLITDGDTANGNFAPGDTNYAVADHGVHFGWQWGQNSAIFPSLTDNKYQYSGLTFERDNVVFACDEFGINHGYLMNGCRTAKDTVSPTRGGRVLPLDGVSQYVELHNSLHDFKDSTFAVWCKPTGAASDQRLWTLGDGANKMMFLTQNAAATGKPRLVITDGATTQTLDSGTAIPLNTWRHLAVVFSGPTCTLYLNGASVATNPAMTLFPDSLNAPLMENANYLGRGYSGNHFQGSLDDFRVYNKALSAAEVTALYTTAAPAPVTITADTAAPTPDAATWLVAPMSNGDSTATMSATPGTDASGWVEYYFTCVSGGGHDSGWVSFNKYTDVGLTPGAAPGYTVKMRDRAGNTTGASASATVTPQTSTAGSASFSYGPIGIATGQITMTAATATNASGKVEYKFDRTLPSTASSGWQSSPTWTQGGLTTGTSYTYTVTVRDGRGNTSDPSAPASAVASDTASPALPIPAAHWQMQPYATIDNKVCMTAQTVTESGVQVYYQCVGGGGPDSGWLAATATDDGGKSYFARWTTPNALADGNYSYKYKLKDAAGNESAYATTYTAKITPTTGYHSYTLAQVLAGADDNLVVFPATVLKANADNYQVKDLASGSSIIVRPNTYAQVTDPSLALKNVTVKGHLYTFSGVRVVTYASLTVTGTPTLDTISGRVTNASGAGIAAATVAFSDVADASAHAIVTTTTDANGNYSRGVNPGTWFVAVTSTTYNTSADQSVILGTTPVSGINFTLVANTTVAGTITRASDGAPLAGASVYFSRSPGALGGPVFTATTDASGNYSQSVQNGVWYVSAGATGFYAAADKTITVNGMAVASVGFALAGDGRNIPRTSDLLFSAITDSLPNSGATGPWPTYQPAGQTLAAMGSPTMAVFNSRKWISNLYADGDGFLQGTYADAIPINGATIIVAARPIRNTTGTPSTSIVNIFYDRLALGIRNSTGKIDVYRNGTLSSSTSSIPTGQTTILSLVVQPTGQFKVWANGTLMMDVTTTSAMTSLVSNLLGGYSNAINVGRYNSDAMTTFNGGIGDVFVYKVALSDAERLQLETDVSAKFIPSYHTVTVSAGTGGYINPTGAVSVSPGGSETFTIRPLAGHVIDTVTADGAAQGVISSYTFANVTANHTLSATFKAGTNSPPVISPLGTQQVAANGSSGPLAFTIGDAETTAANLTLSAASTNPAVVPVSNIVFGGSGANRTVTIAPAMAMIGSTTLTLMVSDGLAVASCSFVLNVTSPPGAPSISAVADQSLDEDHATPAIPLTLADDNTPATSLTVTGTSSNSSLVPAANIVFSGSGAERSVVITPLPNQSGSTFITLTVSDGTTPVGIAFQLTVNPVNDPPVIGSVADQSIPQDSATAAIPFAIGDLETPSTSLIVTATTSNPALVPVTNLVLGGSGANRNVVLTPVAGKTGLAIITLTVNDGSATASESFPLTVTPAVSPATISINVGANGAIGTADLAGAVPVSHWNNLLGASNPGAAAGSLVDYNGTAVAGMAAAFQGGQNTFNAGSNPNTNLLSGFLSSTPMSATITGVPYPRYDLYVYYNGFVSNHSLTWRLSNVTGSPVVLSTQYSVRGSASSGSLFTANGNSHVLSQYASLSAADAAAAAGNGGTYLKFTGLTAAAIKIEETSDGGFNENGFSGIQIVSAGAGTAPLVSDVPDLTISENSATGPLPFTVADAETPAAALTVTASSSNPTLAPNGNIVLGGSGANRTVTVTPAPDQGGTAVISLAVSDGTFSSVESFQLTVLAANHAPTISGIADLTVDEDAATAAVPFLLGDDLTPVDSLTVTATSSNLTLVPHANIVLGGSGANRTVTVTPLPNQHGAATITLGASDGVLGTTRSFLLTVNPVNDLPTISYLADLTVVVNTATGAVPFTVGDVETPVASLAVSGSSSNPSLVPNANIVIGGSGAIRTVTVTPAANQTGTTVISLHASDGTASTDASFTLVVTPPNAPPTISAVADQSVNEDVSTGALAFTIGDDTTAPEALVLTAGSSNTALVSVSNMVFGGSGANRTVTVTPALNLSGSATLTLNVSDGSLSASQSFLLTVTPVNDAPTLSPVADQWVAVNTPASALPVTVGDVETPAASLVVTGSSSNLALVPNANVIIGGSAANRTVTVTPVPDLTGTAVITLAVSDGTATTTGSFTLVVSANTPPTISNVSDREIYQDSATGPITVTVGDAESAAASLVVTAASSNPALVSGAHIVLGGSAASRTVTVTPATGQTGATTITVTVSDGSLTASDSFVLTVTSAVAFGWTGLGGDNNWSTAANWDAVYVSGGNTDLTFSGTAARLTSNNDGATDVNSVRKIVFGGTAASYALTGSRFNLYGSIDNNSANKQTFSATPNFIGGTRLVGGSGNMDFGNIYSNIVGAQFVKVGAGSVQVKPGADLTFKGAFRVEAGTLTLDRTSALVFNSLSSMDMAGGQLTYTVSGSPAADTAAGTAFAAGSSSKIYVTQGTSSRAKVDFGALSRAEGATNLFAYSRADRSTMTCATGNSDFTAVGGKLSILGGAYVQQNEAVALEFAFATRLTGDRAGGGTLLSNQLQALGYTGTPYSSSLTATADVNLPAGSSVSGGAITINSLRFNTAGGATVDLSPGDLRIASGGLLVTPNVGANAITFNGGKLTSAQAELFVHQYNAGAGTRTLTIHSVISDNPASVTLVKAGAGVLVLGGANTFSGNTYLNAGIVQLTNPLALQNSTLTLNEAGTGELQFGSGLTAATVGGLQGSRNLSLMNQAATPAAVTLSLGTNDISTVYSGELSGGGAVIKTGDGTLTLSGNHGYAGATTVDRGRLLVNGSLAAASNVTVAAGGILGGTGTVNGPTIHHGTLAPGASVGTLAMAALTMNADSRVEIEFADWAGTTPGTGWDLVNCASLALAGTPADPITIKLLPFSLANFSESARTFTIATSNTAITGFTADTFAINHSAMPGTGTWSVQLDATGRNLQLCYTLADATDALDSWRAEHFTPGEIAAGLAADDADPDGDGSTNLVEFAFNGNPHLGASSGLSVTRLADGADGDTAPELTFTCAVRRGAVFAPTVSHAQASLPIDGLVYTIEGCGNLNGPWDSVINHQGSSDTAPDASGLPDLTGTDWQYHTFSGFNGIAASGFLRAGVAKP